MSGGGTSPSSVAKPGHHPPRVTPHWPWGPGLGAASTAQLCEPERGAGFNPAKARPHHSPGQQGWGSVLDPPHRAAPAPAMPQLPTGLQCGRDHMSPRCRCQG